MAATNIAAITPVLLILSLIPEPGNTPSSPEPEATSPVVPSLADELEVEVGKAVDIVTGSEELLKEVAEYGAEKV